MIPNGCTSRDFMTSPRKNHEIEWPKPQPGQKSNPIFFKGQRLKCPHTGSVKANDINAASQIKASKLYRKKCQPLYFNVDDRKFFNVKSYGIKFNKS